MAGMSTFLPEFSTSSICLRMKLSIFRTSFFPLTLTLFEEIAKSKTKIEKPNSILWWQTETAKKGRQNWFGDLKVLDLVRSHTGKASHHGGADLHKQSPTLLNDERKKKLTLWILNQNKVQMLDHLMEPILKLCGWATRITIGTPPRETNLKLLKIIITNKYQSSGRWKGIARAAVGTLVALDADLGNIFLIFFRLEIPTSIKFTISWSEIKNFKFDYIIWFRRKFIFKFCFQTRKKKTQPQPWRAWPWASPRKRNSKLTNLRQKMKHWRI